MRLRMLDLPRAIKVLTPGIENLRTPEEIL
jgi:hypothetical protein